MAFKKYFIYLLLFVSNLTLSQDWIKTSLTDFATIDFPSESELSPNNNEIVYVAEDDSAFYIVSIRMLTDNQDSLIKESDLSQFYDGVAHGAIDASNAKLNSKKNIIVRGHPAMDLEFESAKNLDSPQRRFKRILYINQHLLTLDFLSKDLLDEETNESKDKFFNSLIFDESLLNTDKETVVSEDTHSDTAFKTGFILGQLFFYLIVIAVLIGFILLIMFLIRKNRNSNSSPTPKKVFQKETTKIECANCKTENESELKYCFQCGFKLPHE